MQLNQSKVEKGWAWENASGIDKLALGYLIARLLRGWFRNTLKMIVDWYKIFYLNNKKKNKEIVRLTINQIQFYEKKIKKLIWM